MNLSCMCLNFREVNRGLDLELIKTLLLTALPRLSIFYRQLSLKQIHGGPITGFCDIVVDESFDSSQNLNSQVVPVILKEKCLFVVRCYKQLDF